MHRRTQKQVIIGLVSVIILSATIFGFVSLVSRWSSRAPVQPPPVNAPPKPIFRNIEVGLVNVIEVEKNNTFDAIAKVTNPNLEYGSPRFIYEFVFYSANREVIKKISGSSFILANQTRYLVRPAVRLEAQPQDVELNILSQTWQRLAPFTPSGLIIDSLNIRRDETLKITYVSGIVRNRTSYNLKDVEVNLALRDSSNGDKIIAAGATNLQLLDRGTARSFQILWPVLLPYFHIDAKVESNFFENSNFLKDYVASP